MTKMGTVPNEERRAEKLRIESRERREESGEFARVPSRLFIAKSQILFGGYWLLPLACQLVDLRFIILISFSFFFFFYLSIYLL